MNQDTGATTAPAVSFETCFGCGIHGQNVFHFHGDGTGARPMSRQPEVWSKEAALMQVTGLAVDRYIDAEQVRQLVQQILASELAPTEAEVDVWPWRALRERMAASRDFADFGGVMVMTIDIVSVGRPSSQG